ncbi:MAG: VOC family protein [Alphaproteobacteria bacterium]|nr:VOC family protein [Alphaproteobacteria bacterium]
MNKIASVALLVADYDEAIAYYIEVLSFVVLEDSKMSETKRWVRVAPHADSSFSFLLAKAVSDEQSKSVGNQSGGRVYIFYHVSDFWGEYKRMLDLGVDFTEQPREEDYATVVVFKDLYGNKWDMIQQR